MCLEYQFVLNLCKDWNFGDGIEQYLWLLITAKLLTVKEVLEKLQTCQPLVWMHHKYHVTEVLCSRIHFLAEYVSNTHMFLNNCEITVISYGRTKLFGNFGRSIFFF